MSFAGTSTPNKTNVRPKYAVSMVKGKNGSMTIKLSEEQEEAFKRLYPVTTNRKMIELFGIGFSTMQRLKRRFGLEKDMKAIKKKTYAQIRKTCESNGYYDSLRGKRPSEKCIEAYRKKAAEGYHPWKHLKKTNIRRYRKLCKKMSIRRKELIESERRRLRLGLEMETNLVRSVCPLRKYTRREINRRCYAFKNGYILGDIQEERYTLFFNEDTHRCRIFENNAVNEGWNILELTE